MAKKAASDRPPGHGIPPGLQKKDIVLQFTSPTWGNVFVAFNDRVYINETIAPQADVLHDTVGGVEIIRVDLDGDGTYEINPPGTEPA